MPKLAKPWSLITMIVACAAVAVHQVADHGVELLVEPPDVAELCLRFGLGTDRVLFVGVPPEDVRLEVAAGKVEEQQAVVVVIDGVVEEREPLFQDHARLPGELVVGEDAVRSCLVVFLEARGVERTEPAGDVL